MKITIDSESDLGKELIYNLKRTKNFYVTSAGCGEFESVKIYNKDGELLADGCPWYINKDAFTRNLVRQHKFSYQELKEIKKVYDYIDPDQGYDSEE